MAPSARAHNRSHSLLLVQKLLNLRDSPSPLTLILDTVEQSSAPLVREFLGRAKIARAKVIFVSFATVKKPDAADVFIKARGKSLELLRSEITSYCPPTAQSPLREGPPQRVLIIIDSLNSLASSSPHLLSSFLFGVIGPAVSAVAVYHTDIPVVSAEGSNEYEPHPLILLSHLSTAVLKVSNLYQAVERRRAQNRSLPEPEWGIDEGREGVFIGINTRCPDAPVGSLIVDMELRRRSGRAVTEKFVLVPDARGTPLRPGSISLMSDHPLFAPPPDDAEGCRDGGVEGDIGEMGTTFNLSLTEKQRKDREGIVLPYFDAQTDIGAGEGGRILYDMGQEDDFDEEEDEI